VLEDRFFLGPPLATMHAPCNKPAVLSLQILDNYELLRTDPTGEQ
jgi:hypothetical protein